MFPNLENVVINAVSSSSAITKKFKMAACTFYQNA